MHLQAVMLNSALAQVLQKTQVCTEVVRKLFHTEHVRNECSATGPCINQYFSVNHSWYETISHPAVLAAGKYRVGYGKQIYSVMRAQFGFALSDVSLIKFVSASEARHTARSLPPTSDWITNKRRHISQYQAILRNDLLQYIRNTILNTMHQTYLMGRVIKCFLWIPRFPLS